MTDRRRRNTMERAARYRAISRREVLRIGGVVIPAGLLLPAWLPTNAQAAVASTSFDFYISPNGSDSNPGTLAAPWAITSLVNTNANNSKMAGKRVGLIAGTYAIAGMKNGQYPTDNNFCVLSPPAGSAGSPTYIGSSDTNGNYSPRVAIINVGGGQHANGIIGPDRDNGYVTIDGLTINGQGLDSGNAGSGHIFQAYFTVAGNFYTTAGNGAGIVVKNCELYGVAATSVGMNEGGIFLQGCIGAIVQNNYIHDIQKPAQPGHCHAFEEYGSLNTQVIYNTFANCCAGVESKCGGSGTLIAYNYFYNCAPDPSDQAAVCQGFDGGEGNPNSPGGAYSIHNNIFDGCGVAHRAEFNTNIMYQGMNWYNNTTYDTRSGSNEGCHMNSGPNLVRYYNNIIVTTASTGGGGGTGFPGQVNVASNGCTVLDYNCYYGMSGYNGMWGVGGAAYSTLGSWQSATNADARAIVSNPNFTQQIASGKGAAQFQLASGSPCIGASRVGGVASGAVGNMGAWDGTVTQIGCNFTSGSGGTATPIPSAPSLTVS